MPRPPLRCFFAVFWLQAARTVLEFLCLLTAGNHAHTRALNALALLLSIAGIGHHETDRKGGSLINQTKKSGSTTA